ncbi:MAG: hypothetical protein ACOC37_00595 [Spirochaetota bacterium]
MGLFDTILVDPPLTCSRCGAELELQTRLFDPAMITYRVGSLLTGSPVVTGILEEAAFCHDCYRAERETTDPIFLVVWHHILAGVERTEAAAESRLASIDRIDLIDWLDHAQRAEREWRRRFRGLYRDVRMWHEHLQREASKDEEEEEHGETRAAARVLARFHRLPDEIVAAGDPLAEILARNEESSPEHDGMF